MEKIYERINIPELRLFKQGKVRDVYEWEDKLLIVATDRISAFDWVLPSLIPDKGKVLTQLSKFWFDQTAYICPNHVVTAEADEFPAVLPHLHPLHQGRRGPRPQHPLQRDGENHRKGPGQGRQKGEPQALSEGFPLRNLKRDHHRRHEIRVRTGGC